MQERFLIVLVNALLTLFAIASGHAAEHDRGQAFAQVGGTILSTEDFDAALNRRIRSHYYHGEIPESALATIHEEVAEELINRTLLLGEAASRGLKIDETAVQTTLDQYDERYGGNPRWQSQREQMLGKLERSLREEALLQALETSVRRVAPPTQAELHEYYGQHPESFTEPARMRVSLILLGVDPSSPQSTWDAARAEAARIVKQLDSGKSFEELARLHSSDRSLEHDGDMGYLHEGMLGASAQLALDAIEVGAHTQPIRVLEGIAVLKLTDRTEPQLRDYQEVRPRAQELWIRERGEAAWQLLIEQLRAETAITLYRESAGGSSS